MFEQFWVFVTPHKFGNCFSYLYGTLTFFLSLTGILIRIVFICKSVWVGIINSSKLWTCDNFLFNFIFFYFSHQCLIIFNIKLFYLSDSLYVQTSLHLFICLFILLLLMGLFSFLPSLLSMYKDSTNGGFVSYRFPELAYLSILCFLIDMRISACKIMLSINNLIPFPTTVFTFLLLLNCPA